MTFDMEFTSLESAVLQWMASHATVANLAEQLSVCRPVERDLTGVGSFTKLVVPIGTLRIDFETTRSVINGPWIECEGIPYGGSALLFLDNSGHVKTLELVANGDSFDESAASFVLHDLNEPGSPPKPTIVMPLERTMLLNVLWSFMMTLAFLSLFAVGPSIPSAVRLMLAASYAVVSYVALLRRYPWTIVVAVLTALILAVDWVPMVVINCWMFASGDPLYLDSPGTIFVVATYALLFVIPSLTLLVFYVFQWRSVVGLFRKGE